MRKSFKLLAFVMIAAMTFLTVSPAAQASVKSVTATKIYSDSNRVRTGTSRVVCSGDVVSHSYYVKFKAPKKGTYKLTFSNFDDSGLEGVDSTNCVFFLIRYRRDGKLHYKPFASDSRAAMTDVIISKEHYEYLRKHDADGIKYYPTSDSIKVKMNKGAIIYIQAKSTCEDGYSYKVKIKRV